MPADALANATRTMMQITDMRVCVVKKKKRKEKQRRG
jgi:hypothetical protein